MKKTFDELSYNKARITDLILLGVNSLTEKKEKCTFERLVKECFTLFPKAFNFSLYPSWPDSRKLDRPLRTLRKRKLIKGNPKTSFTLTKTGQRAVQELVKTLRQRKLKL